MNRSREKEKSRIETEFKVEEIRKVARKCCNGFSPLLYCFRSYQTEGDMDDVKKAMSRSSPRDLVTRIMMIVRQFEEDVDLNDADEAARLVHLYIAECGSTHPFEYRDLVLGWLAKTPENLLDKTWRRAIALCKVHNMMSVVRTREIFTRNMIRSDPALSASVSHLCIDI